LNVINYTILCNNHSNLDFFILSNCNLLKILPNYILNYTRAYNLISPFAKVSHFRAQGISQKQWRGCAVGLFPLCGNLHDYSFMP